MLDGSPRELEERLTEDFLPLLNERARCPVLLSCSGVSETAEGLPGGIHALFDSQAQDAAQGTVS